MNVGDIGRVTQLVLRIFANKQRCESAEINWNEIIDYCVKDY